MLVPGTATATAAAAPDAAWVGPPFTLRAGAPDPGESLRCLVSSSLHAQPARDSPVLTHCGPGDEVRYAQSPEEFAEDMSGLAREVAAVGGCCGTDPRFLRALGERLGDRASAGPSWSPATDAPFDTGLLVLGESESGCLWVEEED